MKDIKDVFNSKKSKAIVSVILIILAALAIFQAGIFVGFHKAKFSYGLGNNYYQTFGDFRGAIPGRIGEIMPRGLFHEEVSTAHGVAGKIISVSLPTIIVEGRDNIEKIISINDDTQIREFRNTIRPEGLKVGDQVIVIGDPNNQSQIEAELIRVVPMATNDSFPPITK